MNSYRIPVRGESWGSFFAIVFGTWMMVWLYAAIHNQYLIRIQPEHFTVYHYRIPFSQNYTFLGIAYAFGASMSPGVLLGMGLYIAGRLFNRPKLKIKSIILSTAWVWLVVEICAITTGVIVWHSRSGIYPDWVYPNQSRGLLTTQTIQITAYLTGAVASLFLIGLTWSRRKGSKRGAAVKP